MKRKISLLLAISILLTMAAVPVAAIPRTVTVTVPTVLPIYVSSDGAVTTAADACIVNHSGIPVTVSGVAVLAENGWTLAPWGTDYAAVPVDSKLFSLSLNGEDAYGTDMSGGFGEIPANGTEEIAYDAALAVQTVNLSETVAGVVFTVTWDEALLNVDLTSIAVTTPPTKTSYTAGDAFNPADMVVTATYSDGSTAIVSGWTVTNGAALTAGQTSITISYTEDGVTKTTTQTIFVAEPVAQSICITVSPTKLVYDQYEAFEPTGMAAVVTYTNGTQTMLYDGSGITVSPGTFTDAGTVSVTLSFTSGGATVSTTLSVTVKRVLVPGMKYLIAEGSIRLLDAEDNVLETVGTYSGNTGAFTVPKSGNWTLELHGGGGGGGTTTWTGATGGAGGSSGSTQNVTLQAQSYSFTIGAGGAKASGNQSQPSAGGSTSFGSYSVSGGAAGKTATFSDGSNKMARGASYGNLIVTNPSWVSTNYLALPSGCTTDASLFSQSISYPRYDSTNYGWGGIGYSQSFSYGQADGCPGCVILVYQGET